MSDLQRFLIFFVIGIFNTLFDFTVWNLLLKIFENNPNIESLLNKIFKKVKLNKYSFSHLISYTLAIFVSYFLNKNLAFYDSKVADNTKSFGSFLAVSLFSLAISVFLLNILTKNKFVLKLAENLPHVLKPRFPLLAKILVAMVTMVTNFVGYKLFVF